MPLKKSNIIKFNLKEIAFAVDLAIGDDGTRSKEVIEILRQLRILKREEK